jgi:multicomponent Na+:H+ antiporter subunit F
MNEIFLAAALILLLTLVAGLVRIQRGPTETDRMLSAQLFGTTGVAILLLLAFGTRQWALVNVALVFSLLAVIATVAFIRRIWQTALDGASEPAIPRQPREDGDA